MNRIVFFLLLLVLLGSCDNKRGQIIDVEQWKAENPNWSEDELPSNIKVIERVKVRKSALSSHDLVVIEFMGEYYILTTEKTNITKANL